MTAREMFETTMALMFSDEADEVDYEPLFIRTVNWLIAENFKTNNAIRITRGKEEQAEPPLVIDMNSVVDMEHEFTRYILPMGCAGYIYTDDDRGIGAAYKDKYEFERTQVLSAKYEEIDYSNMVGYTDLEGY